MDPKATRHDDLKGDRDLVYYLNPRDPNYTHYNGYFSGTQVDDKVKAEVLDTFTVSAMQMPSPDPVVMHKSIARAHRFETETKNLNNRLPQTTTLSPGQTRDTKFFNSDAFKTTTY